jgi:hypothetical protein
LRKTCFVREPVHRCPFSLSVPSYLRPAAGHRPTWPGCQLGRADGDDDAAQFLLRTVLLLTSPMAWLYWKDYLGLDVADAAETAGWAIKALADARQAQREDASG